MTRGFHPQEGNGTTALMYVLCSTSGFKRLFLMRILRLRSLGDGSCWPASIWKHNSAETFINTFTAVCEGTVRFQWTTLALWVRFSQETKAGLVWICVRGNRRSRTGNPSSGCLSNRSPKISSQYRAILYCCGLLQHTHTHTHSMSAAAQNQRSTSLTLTQTSAFTCSGSQRTE